MASSNVVFKNFNYIRGHPYMLSYTNQEQYTLSKVYSCIVPFSKKLLDLLWARPIYIYSINQ
jgi:hypothetical protein